MKARIYKIVNDIDDQIYVGSTRNPLFKRMACHRYAAKIMTDNRKLYVHMRNVGIKHFSIVLIEECEYEDRLQVRIKEDEYIKALGAGLNSSAAILDVNNRIEKRRRYRAQNRAKINASAKVYRTKNNARIREYLKEYYHKNKDYFREYKRKKKTQKKQTDLKPIESEQKI